MVTKIVKNKQIERAEKNKIFLYHFEEAHKEIRKGNETIQVLYLLLLQEVTKHNAVIKRKVNIIKNQGTSD